MKYVKYVKYVRNNSFSIMHLGVKFKGNLYMYTYIYIERIYACVYVRARVCVKASTKIYGERYEEIKKPKLIVGYVDCQHNTM